MLNKEYRIPFSQFNGLYDIVVKKDHKLRRILELIDFNFVYDELKNKYCHDNGRMAKDPVMMFKYLFLKTFYGLSDRCLVERCMTDMACKFFLGLNPEDEVIAPTTLTKFRRQRLQDIDIIDVLLKRSVQVAKDHNLIDGSTIIVDSTHSLSKSNPVPPVKMLQRLSANLRKVVYNIDETYTQKMPQKYEGNELEKEMEYIDKLVSLLTSDEKLMLHDEILEKIDFVRETVEDIKDHYTTSLDKDARIGHKSVDTEFFGYKTHIAITPDRLIVAATVTSGEKNDGKELPTLIEKTKEKLPELKRVIGDGAYAGNTNLEIANEQGIEIIAKVNTLLIEGTQIERQGFTYNKDAEMMVCPAGHMAKSKAVLRAKRSENDRMRYTFSRTFCKSCKLKEKCNAKGVVKRYCHPIQKPSQLKQLEFMKTEEFKRWSKERYKIEAKNSELKHQYGYNKADYYGIYSMKLQGAVALFTSNMSRILRLMDEKA